MTSYTPITENTDLMKASPFLTTFKQDNQHISMMIIFHRPVQQAISNKNKTCLKTTETPEANPFYPNLEHEIKQFTFLLQQIHSFVL